MQTPAPLMRPASWSLELVALCIGCLVALVVLAGIAVAGTVNGLGGLTSGGLLQSGASSLVVVTPANAGSAAGTGRPGALTLADIQAVARAVPDAPLTSRVVSSTDVPVTTDAPPHATVEGVDPAYALLRGGPMLAGAFFTSQEAIAANPVAVLGQAVARSLFPDEQAAIGRTVRIAGQPFTVIGVLGPQDGASADKLVFVPFQTAQVRLFGSRSAYALVLKARDAGQAAQVRSEVQQLLQQRHRTSTDQSADFTIRTDATPAAGPAQTSLQTVLQAIHLAEQYTCQAKSLCSPT